MHKIVMCNGCFDLLHAGHVAHLREARSFGTRLIVALTLDEHVHKGHGRPVYPFAERAALLMAMRCVDQVAPSQSSAEAILRWHPHVFVKGIDYMNCLPDEDVRACLEVGAEIRFTCQPKMSTTQIIERIRN